MKSVLVLHFKRSFQVALLLLTCLGVACLCVGVSYAEPEKESSEKKEEKKPLKIFMRKKLAASAMILEGLTMEDFTLVTEGARKLQEMSQTEQWRVRNDPMYRQFSGEFQRNIEKLTESAKQGKLDASALKWVGVTMSCIECHQYVRKVAITEK